MINTRTLSNGVVLVVEELDAVQSCAMSWLIPAGSSGDPAGALGEGESTILGELLLRGAGPWESRAHSEALDALGVDRRAAASIHHQVISATLLSDHLVDALPLISAMVTAPRFEEPHLEPAKRLALQSLAGLVDEPQHLAMVRLNERFFPSPFNRSGMGNAEGIKALTIARLRDAWTRRARPGGSIIAIAGRVRIDPIAAQLETLLAEWRGAAVEPTVTAPAVGGSLHVPSPSAQTHLAMGLWAPTESAPEALLHRMAIKILGGEASSRLFTEVRERRGLCYSVGAGASLGRDRGVTTVYAGSTPERAETTLGQIRIEIARLANGIDHDEFERARVGFRSRLVMQGESTSARASSIASEIHRLGRARTLEERSQEVEATTFDALDGYVRGPLAKQWSCDPTLVVVGPNPIGG